jgi:sugar lactone lactonase YvrE
MRRVMLFAAWMAVAATILAAPLAASSQFPERIGLPNGFRPEGIAIGSGSDFYVGSIPSGAIYGGDLRTGEGEVIIEGATGRAAIGIEYRRGLLLVAGGPTGKAFVYSVRSRSLLAEAQLASLPIDPVTAPTFVNDVAIARGGAYFTDSQRPFLYRLGRGGVTRIPLSGDYVHQPGFNLNGIEATRNGETLVVVQSPTGKLFTVDPQSGVTDEIAINQPVVNGDGLLLDGRTLYVVQNRDNEVAVVRLDRGLESGTVQMFLTDPDFDVPTTIDEFGKRLYAVNARFTTPPTPTTPYWLAQFQKVRGR